MKSILKKSKSKDKKKVSFIINDITKKNNSLLSNDQQNEIIKYKFIKSFDDITNYSDLYYIDYHGKLIKLNTEYVEKVKILTESYKKALSNSKPLFLSNLHDKKSHVDSKYGNLYLSFISTMINNKLELIFVFHTKNLFYVFPIIK